MAVQDRPVSSTPSPGRTRNCAFVGFGEGIAEQSYDSLWAPASVIPQTCLSLRNKQVLILYIYIYYMFFSSCHVFVAVLQFASMFLRKITRIARHQWIPSSKRLWVGNSVVFVG